jgi:uncharacterized protein
MADVALITGASAGLGAEFARQLAGQGRRLVLVARRKDRLEALAKEVGNARTVAMDLAEPGAAGRLMADIESHGEGVDLLVNNAGFGLWGRFRELDPARQREMVDLNCGVLMELCRLAAPAMIERRHGFILNVASTAAFQPGPRIAVYFATKAFVLSFSEALHEELAPSGVHVTALCPGPTRTEFGEVAGFTPRGAFDRLAMDAAPVVRAGLKGLARNRAVVVPGVINRVGAFSPRLLPRALVRKVAGSLKL